MPAQTTASKTSIEHPNLAAALAAFQAELPSVNKGKKANVGQYSYSYADLADVMLAATPLLARNGLSFSCAPKHQDDGTYVLVGALLHASGNERTGELPIMGRTMQEIGSAITYGRRYLLGTLTGLVTDDDDDGTASLSAEPTRRPQRQGARSADSATDAQRHAILSALAEAADTAGVPREEVARRWAEQHGGESLNEATDMPALTAMLDEMRTNAAMAEAASQLGASSVTEGESAEQEA